MSLLNNFSKSLHSNDNLEYLLNKNGIQLEERLVKYLEEKKIYKMHPNKKIKDQNGYDLNITLEKKYNITKLDKIKIKRFFAGKQNLLPTRYTNRYLQKIKNYSDKSFKSKPLRNYYDIKLKKELEKKYKGVDQLKQRISGDQQNNRIILPIHPEFLTRDNESYNTQDRNILSHTQNVSTYNIGRGFTNSRELNKVHY